MSNKKKTKLGFDEEAECADGGSSAEPSDAEEDDDGDFIVEDGELSDSHYYDEEDVLPATAPAAAKKRGRPSGSTKPKQDPPKPPGHSSYPINDFSLTVTKTKDDVGLDALANMDKFIQDTCIKGGVSTEVGTRAFQLHLQGVFRMHWPSTAEYKLRLQKIIKALLPAAGKLYKVLVKPFGTRQEFSAMIGYITKDEGTTDVLLLHFSFN